MKRAYRMGEQPKMKEPLKLLPSEKVFTVTDCSPEHLSHTFQVEKFLGHGGNGIIYRIKDKASLKESALKLSLKAGRQEGVREVNELDLVCSLRHPNLLRLDYFFFDKESHDIGYVMPLANGDLKSYLRKHPFVSFETRLRWAYQFLSALAFLHDNKVHHCDIKPHNCLIIDHQLVLADFGYAHKSFGEEGACTATMIYHSPQEVYIDAERASGSAAESYISRDLHLYKKDINFFTEDIWALGGTLWLLFTNDYHILFKDSPLQNLALMDQFIHSDMRATLHSKLRKIVNYNPKQFDEVINLMLLMFTLDPQQRDLSVSKLLQLPPFNTFEPIKGELIQGTVVKPLDCRQVDVAEYFREMRKAFNRYANYVASKDPQFDNSDRFLFILFNAFDLFIRSFAAVAQNYSLPSTNAIALTYILIAHKITFNTNAVRDQEKLLRRMGGNRAEAQDVFALERSVICTLSGIMHRVLPYELVDRSEYRRLLEWMLANCDVVCRADADEVVGRFRGTYSVVQAVRKTFSNLLRIK
jgi:serine/threonine protein kinase